MEYNPVILSVSRRPFYWRVHFADGQTICEYDEKANEHLYKEVLDKVEGGGEVSSIDWYPTYEGLPMFSQELESWQRPVIFRRNKIRMDNSGREIIYAIGWQATVGGKNYKSITYIDLPNDTIITKSG